MSGERAAFHLRLSLLLCGLLVSAPFLNPFHTYPLLTFYTEWLAFVLGVAALGAMASGPSRNALPVPAMCAGLFALTGLVVLQLALGQVHYPLRSALGALYPVWAGLLVLLGAWMSSELGEAPVARSLQGFLAVAGTLAALSGFIQYYHVPLPGGSYAAVQPLNAMFGTVNQPNNFADYLGCALVTVAFLHARSALALLPSLFVALLLATGMALSGSRASWGYVAIGFALVPLVRIGGHPHEARRVLRLMFFALAVFALVQVLNLYTGIFAGPEGRPSSAGERLVRYWEFGSPGAEHSIRIQLFLYAWSMFASHPLLGVGFGEYASHAFQLAGDAAGAVPPGIDRHSHNLFLQLMAELGIGGLLCVAVPLLRWVWLTPWRKLSPERCWAIGVLGVIGLHSMVEFPLWHANFLGVFALLLGVASPVRLSIELSRLRRGLLLLVAVAAGFSAWSVWSDYRDFERWYLAVEAKGARGELPVAGDLENLLELREGSFFGPYLERIASEAIALDGRNLGEKLALNTEVMRAYPMPSVVLRQAALLALSGSDAEAARTLRAAIRVYPESTRQWLPTLEKLARDQPARFSGLADFARAQLRRDRR